MIPMGAEKHVEITDQVFYTPDTVLRRIEDIRKSVINSGSHIADGPFFHAFGVEIEKLKDEMLSQLESFSHVFETDAGSVYFVFNDGKSLRFAKDKGEWRNNIIYNYLYFVSIQTSNDLIKKNNDMLDIDSLMGRGYLNVKIPVVGLGIDVIPMEFGEYSNQDGVGVEPEDNTIEIVCSENGGLQNIHFGTVITKVVK